MSNIDKHAVQAVADLKAGYTLGHADVEIIQQMTLDAVTLLDELEALKLANAAQDDHINQQQDRIDLLEKGNNEAARQINSLRRLAKQNIAEREKDVSELNIARKRIAELEAREVELPAYRNSPDMHTKQYYEAVGFNQGLDACTEVLRAAGISVKGE
ncbi:hypothetical protein NOX44_001774 [Enterobacter hormaechei]|uniref:hypothetical protein n=1 Tax=Enterobacter hormaechei TaxID=158836 RepID=UPI0025A92D8C|nr:hypothetical protein [Enterobacter hormaechei]EKW5527618.1 hypothetical protein [Enterobacter hormaechei]